MPEDNNLTFSREERSIDIQSMYDAMIQKEASYQEEDLYKDLNWIEASGKIYEMNEGKKFEGDYKKLAKYGIDQMSEFNFNITFGMIPDVMKVHSADSDTQVAFAYLMDTYDKKDITFDGMGRALKAMAYDPLTWLAPGSILGKKIASRTVEEVAKNSIKERLLSSLFSPAGIAAMEGGMYTAGDTTARQSIYQDAELMEGYDPATIATSGALGAVAGAGIVKGAEAVSTAINKGYDKILKQTESQDMTEPKTEGR